MAPSLTCDMVRTEMDPARLLLYSYKRFQSADNWYPVYWQRKSKYTLMLSKLPPYPTVLDQMQQPYLTKQSHLP